MKKFFSIILSLLMMCSFTLTACKNNDTPHTCSSKCSVCQLCTDEDCTDSACSNKCQGHGEEHTCQSVCPTCGGCMDSSCTEPACVNKCQGHTPAPGTHTCESVCPICGNCMDETCTETACVNKCAGHEQAEMTAAQFVANTSNYLTDANEGISAAAAALGGSIELSYDEPFFPMSATATASSSSVKSLSARKYNAYNSIVLLSDAEDEKEEEMMLCAKCGQVEVPVSQKYCDACKAAMGGQTAPKNYSTGSALEQYIIFNSVARKIQLIVGATEYYTEYDFAFPNENELALIGTVKFEGEFTKLLKEIEDYELGEDGFYVIEEPQYADGTWNPEIGDFDKDLGGQTLIGKRVRGFKLEGNTLITSTYYVSYDFMNNNEESISEEVYVEYTMDGNNFYYQKYKMVEGQKVVVDMFDIIKEEPNENTLGDVYYVQMTLNGEEEITGMPAVYFEEAVDIADQWQRYVNEKMGTGYHGEVPTKVYLNGRIQKVDYDVMYEMYYFRDYDYAVAGYESSCYVYPIENWEEFYGEYYYEYTRGNSAPLPESWRNGFDTSLGANLEGMIESSLYDKYAETLVFRASGNVQMPEEGAKYYPFQLKESSATLDINDSYEIIASSADDAVWNWSSSNEEVATVSGGYVQSGSVEGEAIITVQRNNLVRYFYVLVRNRLVTDNPEEMTIRLGTTGHAFFNAYSNQNDVIVFSSDNEEIVTIDETGWITAHKEGATAVWAATQDGERFEKMFVRVVGSADIVSFYQPNEGSEDVISTLHLLGLGKISVTYDTVLSLDTEYYMLFEGLDEGGSFYQDTPINGLPIYNLLINGRSAVEHPDVTVSHVYEEYQNDTGGTNSHSLNNYRSVTFHTAGTYKFEFWYQHQGGEFVERDTNQSSYSNGIPMKNVVILEINVTVGTPYPYRYDATTHTYYVSDYAGLLAWYEAQQLNKSTNLVLEADIYMPTVASEFLFDLDGDGVNESNWGLETARYTGTIDGNGKYIRGLTMNIDESANNNTRIAFVSQMLHGGVIKNINFADGQITSRYVSGVVGRLAGGEVLNCTNANTLFAWNAAAGIVFDIWGSGRIFACVNYGSITCENGDASGIVCGYSVTVGTYATVVGCINYGSVQGNIAGGIVPRGANWKLYGCADFGTVTGETSGNVIAKQSRGVGLYGCVYSLDEGFKVLERLTNQKTATVSDIGIIEDAIVELNAAIEQCKATSGINCKYRYVLNTNPTTSEAYPLILQEVTDAQ